MAKYLIAASYTLEGMRGVREKGAKTRADAVRHMIEKAGGSMESFHFAFGDDDVYIIADVPNDETAAALAFSVSSSGGATTRTTKLLTVDQAEAALGIAVDYTKPGG